MTLEANALALLSPSLLPAEKGKPSLPSYEMKFLLPRERAAQVEAWARAEMALDPHAEPALDHSYRIGSIYFDTDQYDVFRQSPGFRRRKYRLRRYGAETGVYLERKTKSGDRVSKRRVLIAANELDRLQAAAIDATWAGGWFQRRLQVQQLRPRCLLSYERSAYVGMSVEGPHRLTLDRNIQCAPADDCDFERPKPRMPILSEDAILELKYRAALPALFKRLLQEFGLSPSRVSKYRTAIVARGLAQPVREVG